MTGDEGQQPTLPVQQLAILAACRFAEPVALTSINPYLPEMIERFGVPEDEVAKWAGITAAAFSVAQCFTTFSWQTLADRIGRKYAILFSMVCSQVSTMFFGLSTNLTWAIVSRCFLGASSGSLGIIRTMVAELVPYKSLQARAFTIMPVVWCVGSVFGPMLGGAFAFPVEKFPTIFGSSKFLQQYPFALPNIVSVILFSASFLIGFLFLKETLQSLRHRRDYGLVLGQCLSSSCRRRKVSWMDENKSQAANLKSGPSKSPQSRPSYREIFTFQSSLNLISYTVLSLHATTYDQLIPVFLHLTQQDHSSGNPEVQLPFKFSGGFGIDSGQIGIILAIYGVVTTLTQFLVFPTIAQRYGTLKCLRACYMVFPLVYIATPFAVLLPTLLQRYTMITLIMAAKGLAGVFAWPCTIVLLTNSAGTIPILGTLNAAGTSGAAMAKAIGPMAAGAIFTSSIEKGYIVVSWWILAAIALLGYVTTIWLVELNGPSADGTVQVESNGAEEGDQVEEELALLTAVDGPDDVKHIHSDNSLETSTLQRDARTDEEHRFSILDDQPATADSAVLVDNKLTPASSGAAVGLSGTDLSAASLLAADHFHRVNQSIPASDSTLASSRPRAGSIASSTSRSTNLDDPTGLAVRNAGVVRMRSPTPLGRGEAE